MENAEIDVTEENVVKLKNKCRNIFDDKSERNEMLVNAARLYNGLTISDLLRYYAEQKNMD